MLAITFLIGFCVLLYIVLNWHLNYWNKKGVPQENVWTVLLDNLKGILQYTPVAETITKMYFAFPELRYVGAYQFLQPVLFLRDHKLIKEITVKDFDYFTDHRALMPEETEPLWGKNLLSLKGDRWKHMRTSLSPSFTSSKIKAMFGFMSECAQNFVRHFEEKSETVTVELKDVYTRYTNDVIASASFGITCDSLKEPDNEFYRMGKEATNLSGFWINFMILLVSISPKLSKYLGVRIFSDRVNTFFRKLVKENIEMREKNGIVRTDMIHLLMEARKDKQTVDKNKEQVQNIVLTDDDLTAQALIFFFGGFDSVSTLMCFTTYELAVNSSIQKRLQEEVDRTLEECNGNLTYEALMKMEYMDMILSEALRKWPSNIATDRVCVKPYTIEPTRKGEKPVHLKKGDIIWLPLYSMHRDEKLFPEPERFNPERFSPKNKSSINPYEYMPFGVGPRVCIGNRFALLETKTLLFYILSKFDIIVVEKSTVPLKLSPATFNLSSEGGFWFGFKPRNA